jgi:hypothetical protein
VASRQPTMKAAATIRTSTSIVRGDLALPSIDTPAR